ncbi:MAG: hypothetical protein AB7S50_01615 [Bacteroidales bacterium]
MQVLLTRQLRITLSSLLVLFYLIRLVIPYGNYLLIPLLIFATVISIIRTFKSEVLVFIKTISICAISILVTLLILMLNYLFLSDFNKLLTIEIIHSLSAILILVLLSILIESKDELEILYTKLRKLVILSAGIISILGILKLIYQFIGKKIPILDIAGYPQGSSLTIDSNFSALFFLLGMLFIFYELFSKQTKYIKILYQLFLIIITLNVILSTSRRGLIIILILFFVFLIISILSIIKRESLTEFRKNTSIFLTSTIIFVVFIFYFLFVLSPLVRNKTIVNSPFTKSLTDYLTSWVFETKTIYSGESISYKNIQEKLWKDDFNPMSPYSGWGEGNYTPIEKLEGNNVEIVPKGSVGYKIDRTYLPRTKNGTSYFQTFIFNGTLAADWRYIPSVYCYVSKDFNGEKVRISGAGKLKGLISSYYDLSRKGEWQSLQLSFGGNNKKYRVYLYFSKNDSLAFNNLSGHVIFAYPMMDSVLFNPSNPLSWAQRSFKLVTHIKGKNAEILPDSTKGYLIDNSSNYSYSEKSGAFSSTRLFEYKTIENKRYLSSIYAFVSDDFNGENILIRTRGNVKNGGIDFYDLTKRGEWQKLSATSIGNEGKVFTDISFNLSRCKDFSDLKGYVIFAYPELRELDFDSKDPITYSQHECLLKNNLLIGKNPEILPKGTKGLVIDKNVNGKSHKSFYYYKNIINDINTLDNDSILYRVYCYVSDNFNGSQVRIGAAGKIDGPKVDLYDLKKKNEWQLLKIKGLSKGGRIKFDLFFSQKGVANFSSLQGNIIFTHPEFYIKRNRNWYSFDKIPDEFKKDHNTYMNEVSLKKERFINSNVSDNLDDNFIKNSFTGPRVIRWKFAMQTYKEEYSWWQKIFGGGFDYTKKFAKEFNVKNGYDYPHNPFLSVLLYSGIIGLLAYLWVLYKAVYYYLKYRKEYWALFLCFVVTFYFSFFSGNNPFDPPVMGLFLVLPFFIHYVHQKDKKGEEEKKTIELS